VLKKDGKLAIGVHEREGQRSLCGSIVGAETRPPRRSLNPRATSRVPFTGRMLRVD
jgi:hypothetical protein